MKFLVLALLCVATVTVVDDGRAQSIVCYPQYNVQTVYAQDELPIDIPCAVKAGQAFVSCRQAGGGVFGCALTGFGVYLDCNGGLARSRRSARRSVRAARVQARSRNASRGCF